MLKIRQFFYAFFIHSYGLPSQLCLDTMMFYWWLRKLSPLLAVASDFGNGGENSVTAGFFIVTGKCNFTHSWKKGHWKLKRDIKSCCLKEVLSRQKTCLNLVELPLSILSEVYSVFRSKFSKLHDKCRIASVLISSAKCFHMLWRIEAN